jgi:hypothetical protein
MQRVAKPNWRLKKTLSRSIDFRPIEDDDVRYAFLAYKKGLLVDLGAHFADLSMDAKAFKEAFEVDVTSRYHGAWTLIGSTKKGFRPVGFVLGFWSHPDPSLAPFMNVGSLLWLPWASSRNKIESAVHFFNSIRREIRMMEYARQKDIKFFEMIARHGVMRRVGTSHNVYANEPASVFETRSP